MTLRQIGAIPCRRDEDGEVRVLLVTSRETSRWVIPKGWPVKGLSDRKAAALEALEEAGVKGRVRRKAVGEYSYFKRRQTQFELVQVTVFVMVVERELDEWPEMEERTRRWFSLKDAERKVGEPGLKALIKLLDSTASN